MGGRARGLGGALFAVWFAAVDEALLVGAAFVVDDCDGSFGCAGVRLDALLCHGSISSECGLGAIAVARDSQGGFPYAVFSRKELP